MDRDDDAVMSVEHPVDAYERSLAARGERKRRGSYYTPGVLVEQLIAGALEPAVADALRSPRAEEALLALRVCDPACGTGRLLRAAADCLAKHLARVRGEAGVARARADVVARCLYGIDVDAEAARLCRVGLGHRGRHVRVADALMEERPFMGVAGFDVVLANPPFINGIEKVTDRSALRARFPEVSGAADLAHYFLAAAVRLVRDGGRVGIVQPRGSLNAPSTARLREMLTRGETKGLRPNVIFAPGRSDLFDGALVFACAIVLGPEELCRASVDGVNWHKGRVEEGNWWLAAHRIAEGEAVGSTSSRLGDHFEVRAGMTTGEAYEVRAFVVDDEDGEGPRLVTTGLIDPGVNHWGVRRCRYLKRDYAHPRVNVAAGMAASLRRRVEQARRPKVLVAGLSRRIECVVDERGECVGAVSTFAIFHPTEDVAALRRVAEYLHGEAAHAAFRRELGANAVGGGDTVMKKAFLRGLPYEAGKE